MKEFLMFKILFASFEWWICLFVVLIVLTLWLRSMNKHNKRIQDEHDWTKAEVKHARHSTPDKGQKLFVVGPHKWLFVSWDKKENVLFFCEPKHSYKTPNEYKLYRDQKNWKIIDKPLQRVSVNEYFKKTRIM